ncbi:hypothetical protein [Azonexus sp. IMCC34839]|uniref:hypothetical protein n=1 Tax=Azonexus sp. IMCC34839 TaxID=3133695 RepID=UPI0039995E2C
MLQLHAATYATKSHLTFVYSRLQLDQPPAKMCKMLGIGRSTSYKYAKRQSFESWVAMILFLDTEFTDFHDPELISLALVSECGRLEFYAERTDFNRQRCNEFVLSKVLPKLGQGPSFNSGEFATALLTWLEQVHALDAASNVLVFYDYDTDFALLKDALASSLPAWLEGTNVSGCVNQISWAREGQEEAPTAHHALHDAHELRVDWLASRQILANRLET